MRERGERAQDDGDQLECANSIRPISAIERLVSKRKNT